MARDWILQVAAMRSDDNGDGDVGGGGSVGAQPLHHCGDDTHHQAFMRTMTALSSSPPMTAPTPHSL